ncbi:MAG: NAD(P)-dependent oxidoreductase [Lachnospiraceae bacterium]
MKTILLTNHYKENALRILQSLIPDGYRLLTLPQANQETLLASVREADYLLVSGRLKINEEVLRAASKLKMIQRTGVGLDNMDLEELRKRGIPLYVNKGVNADSVAEHTIMLILSCLRNLSYNSNTLKSGVWNKQEQGIQTHELKGKTVGIIGFGTIGKRVAKLLVCFGANVIYYDSYTKEDMILYDCPVKYEELNSLLQQADIITLHCPLNEETKELISEKTIKLMKKGVIIINTARGKLINASDLKASLREGIVASAGLDVFWNEPPSKEENFCEFPNVITTPHIGGVTFEAFSTMMQKAIENIVLYDQGKYGEIMENRVV